MTLRVRTIGHATPSRSRALKSWRSGRIRGGPSRQAWRSALTTLAARATSPLDALCQVHRIWQRSADGGAAAVYRVDRFLVRVEFVGCALFEIAFFRHAVRAAITRLLEPFEIRLVVRELPQAAGDECHYVVRWNS